MTCFSSSIYVSSFQARQPAPITSSCYHDSRCNHFSPCSSPSALPPHRWTALQQRSCPSLRCHHAYPSQGHLRLCQRHPQPVGPCCQHGLLPPPLWRSLCIPATRLACYDPAINMEASHVNRVCIETAWAALLQDYKAYKAAECSVKVFIEAVVNNTWICDLCNPKTFYSNITALAIFNHLCKHSSSLHVLDMVSLTIQMSQYYVGTPDIPEYIFLLEDAQRKAARACLLSGLSVVLECRLS
jgi:hypothetical protein